MHLAYSILYLLALIFLLPFEYLKRPTSLRKRWLKERFGFIPSVLKSDRVIWIHAVSVGEVIASASLIKKLKEKYTASEIVISTVTDTGQKLAQERFGNLARIIYMPFDLPFSIKKTIKHIQPSLFIIMETELWPNVISVLNRQSVPVLLMNGRISEKSFKGYKKLRFFMKGILKDISVFCMQNNVYADRIKGLGAETGKVIEIGSFKFDTRPSQPVPAWAKLLQGPVIIAGSTHATEEDLIINAYIKLREAFPHLNLIVAPRHPERFREVEELLIRKGLEYIKRSELAHSSSLIAHSSKNTSISHEPSAMSHQLSGVIILLDVIGELASVYGACDIAIMGGSFIPHGGQNPLEPAYWEKAIVCGPHMENFFFIDEFYHKGGAVKIERAGLHQCLKDLLSSPENMQVMGIAAKRLYEQNSGAIDRAMEIMEKYL